MKTMTVDGNNACVQVAYALSELAIIYPITPASPMAELADEWATARKTNLFGQIPDVVQMQSEGGAAGALHGALVCGGLATTFTCSQGLLLMLPNLYKLAGELLPAVVHVSARALATHALSIFGDHQDIMACRQSGCAILSSSTVQEAHDFALAAHLAAWEGSLPFLHFFDGFRTSHEVNKIECLEEEELRALVNEETIEGFRRRALDPDRPKQLGTAQNPDVYFQNRERANERYLSLPDVVENTFAKMQTITKRAYHVFDYCGASDAKYVFVAMGSALSTIEETARFLNARGEKIGVVKVRLYRPFDGKRFAAILPKSCRYVVALDRTKEAGALGEPLYLDICASVQEYGLPIRVLGGRYGLGGKEFTPAQVVAALENAKSPTPKNHFTVGIEDDCTHLSLPIPDFRLPDQATACIFYGLGSDGTVGANKNSIQLIGERTPLFVQGYFCYDSRKSGGVTISHLRFGKDPVRAPYLIELADFVACHNPSYIQRYDMLSSLKEGGTFLLNCPWSDEELKTELPATFKRSLAQKRARLFVIDGGGIAREVGLGGRISTVMQSAFFFLHEGLLPYEEAKALLKEEISRKWKAKGDTMVEMNALCIEKAEENIREIFYPKAWENSTSGEEELPRSKEEYFRNFILPILTLQGDTLPVSAFSEDGSVPTSTSRLEKHGAPPFIPEWLPENCIQCNQCAFVCPHACIRPFLFPSELSSPDDFPALPATGVKEARFRIQVSPHDCMGCGVCARTCPAPKKALVMSPSQPLLHREGGNWEYAQTLPVVPSPLPRNSVKGSQFYPPLFEFSYACSGCGETPYIKLLTQLVGERLVIANATGCSSIYGGSCPTCPYTVNAEGKGPAWANSLFEDNAEFGYGMRLAFNARKKDRSVWIVGGDGWAYDIGYGGLDHILAAGEKVNILVLDSEVYSNTGGQRSKATPTGAVARFASGGKTTPKKDLGAMAMAYRSVYVAQVAMGADKNQLVKAFTEAESYEGPSLIIAYSPCIAHGVYMGECMEEEKRAVKSGYWSLYRYDPRLGDGALQMDSKPPTLPLRDFLMGENRFAQLMKKDPERGQRLFDEAEKEVAARRVRLEKLANK